MIRQPSCPPPDGPSHREQLRQPIERALARHARSRSECEQRIAEPLHPGDLFVFPETAELAVRWAVVDRRGPQVMVVPVDLCSLVGSTDIATPAESASGAATVRCAFEVWLDSEDFDLELRTGFLEAEALDQVRRKRDEIAAGHLSGSVRQQQTDREGEYLDWVEEVPAAARSALLERHRGPGSSEPPMAFSPPSWSDLFPGGDDVDWNVTPDTPVELTLRIEAGADAGPEEAEELALELAAELVALDVDRAELLRTPSVPLGARAAGATVPGELAVVATPEALARLVVFLREWIQRGERRTVKVRAISSAQESAMEHGGLETLTREDTIALVRQLVEAFIGKPRRE